MSETIGQELLSWLENQDVEPEDAVPLLVAAIVALIKSTSRGDRRVEMRAAREASQQILDLMNEEEPEEDE